MLTRRTMLLTAAAMAATPALAASPSEEGVALIRAVYKRGRARPADMSARLRRLFAEDARRDWNRINFDWLRGGQEVARVTNLRVNVVENEEPGQVAIQASFLSSGEETTRLFTLVREKGRLVIDNAAMTPEGDNLLNILTAPED